MQDSTTAGSENLKGGGKGLKLEKKDGGYGKMEEVEGDSHEPEWHHVDEGHSSSPHPPSYLPGEPHPPEDIPAIRYVFTRKSDPQERMHDTLKTLGRILGDSSIVHEVPTSWPGVERILF